MAPEAASTEPMAIVAYAIGQTSTRIKHRVGTMLALSSLADDHMPCGLGEKAMSCISQHEAYISALKCMAIELRIAKREKGQCDADMILAFTAAF